MTYAISCFVWLSFNLRFVFMCITKILHWRHNAVIDWFIDLSFLVALFQESVSAPMMLGANPSMYQCSSGIAVGPGSSQHTSINAGGEESLYLFSQVAVACAKEPNRTTMHCSLPFTHIYSISIGLHFCHITLYANVHTAMQCILFTNHYCAHSERSI